MSIIPTIQTIENGNSYQVALKIAGDNQSNEFRAVQRRWNRLHRGEGLESLKKLEEDLAKLGYRLKVEPIKKTKANP